LFVLIIGRNSQSDQKPHTLIRYLEGEVWLEVSEKSDGARTATRTATSVHARREKVRDE